MSILRFVISHTTMEIAKSPVRKYHHESSIDSQTTSLKTCSTQRQYLTYTVKSPRNEFNETACTPRRTKFPRQCARFLHTNTDRCLCACRRQRKRVYSVCVRADRTGGSLSGWHGIPRASAGLKLDANRGGLFKLLRSVR